MSKIDDIPNNEMAPIYEAFIDWKNQRFLDDVSADVRRGQGYIVGYRTTAEVMGQRPNGEPRVGQRLVKDEATAERVTLAWRMKLEGNASLQEILEATRLYSKREHYSEFFSNLLYAGIFIYHGKRFPAIWETGERFCEPYVTLDEFMRVQALRAVRGAGRGCADERAPADAALPQFALLPLRQEDACAWRVVRDAEDAYLGRRGGRMQ